MWKIRSRLKDLQLRKEIPKYEKFKKENETSNIVKTKREKLYDYYKCDYCKDEIRLDKKRNERSGGIVHFPHTLTKSGKVTLVLCNKCLNNVIKEFIDKN